MKTKIEAAKIALGAGTNMVITTGKVMNPLAAIAAGSKVTWFLAKSDPVTAKKRWIAGQLEPRGTLHVDAGAEQALSTGKSLLPAGVKRVDGEFGRGDAVIIRAPDGRELGRGLARLRARRCRAHPGAQVVRDPGHPGLRLGPRAHPSRRHGPSALGPAAAHVYRPLSPTPLAPPAPNAI